jgi:hypothetical protein
MRLNQQKKIFFSKPGNLTQPALVIFAIKKGDKNIYKVKHVESEKPIKLKFKIL